MRTLTIFLPIVWCLLLCSCARHSVSPGITYLVGPECHPKARLVDCDRNSPPSCKRITLNYDKACEQMVVPKIETAKN